MSGLLLGDLGLLGRHRFQALVEIGRAITRQDFVGICPSRTLALPELLGAPLLGSFPVFGSNLGWVDKHLRARRGGDEQRNHHKSKNCFQMSLRKRLILDPAGVPANNREVILVHLPRPVSSKDRSAAVICAFSFAMRDADQW